MRRQSEENGLKDKEERQKNRRWRESHYGSVPVYIHQQQKAKMPAAGATQALRLFCNPLLRPLAAC
jgi:hypothetical protein